MESGQKENEKLKSLTLQANKYVPESTVPFEGHAKKYIKENEEKFKIQLQKDEELTKHEHYEQWYLGPQYKIHVGKPFVPEEPKKSKDNKSKAKAQKEEAQK